MKRVEMKYILPLFTIVLLMSSCVSSKKMVYVQNAIDSDSIAKITNFEPKIQKGDLLEINIVAVDVEASLPFNLFDTPSVGVSAASTNSKLLPYLVDVHGNIEMPVIGLVQVEGKTSNELKEVLKEKLKPYLKKSGNKYSI
jgi:polysaccharide export outer membrane protein